MCNKIHIFHHNWVCLIFFSVLYLLDLPELRFFRLLKSYRSLNDRCLTWLEEHDGLEAGEFCGIYGERLEAAEDFLQEAQVQAGVAGFALHAGAEVGQREQRAAVQGQRPLDGTEQEELTPRLLQQDHLQGDQRES